MAGKEKIQLVGKSTQKRARLLPLDTAVASEHEGTRRNKLRPPLLNVVLAGPIMRRAATDAVYIWMATSIPVFVEAFVREVKGKGPAGTGSAKSFSMGACLHIVLVRVTPTGPTRQLPTDSLLEYNMLIESNSRHWGFVGDVAFHPNDICLPGFQLPTFVIADADRTRVRFIHGSCRKYHGRGQDATPLALEALQKSSEDPFERPTNLLLTGDQIYADDVHDSLFKHVNSPDIELLALRLLGVERVPGIDKPLANLPKGARWPIVEKGGFSAGAGSGKNHLLELGEFAAMYLIAWSPEIELAYGGGMGNKAAEARKLLANISTYMIFDDHEITDDWNITYDWRTDVLSSVTTRRVISNDLAAFAAFQALGNDAARTAKLPDALTANPAKNGKIGGPKHASSVWDFSKWHDFDYQMWWGLEDWSFIAEMQPKVIFLDTRTQRHLNPKPKANYERVPGLLGPKALNSLSEKLSRFPRSGDKPVVLVSPAPVIGWTLEVLQERKLDLESKTKALDLGIDPEAWSLDSRTFFMFLDVLLLSGHERIVVLSGDVHYGYTAIARYTRQSKSGTRTGISLVQFTSSPVRNQASFRESDGLRVLDHLDSQGGSVVFGWDAADKSSRPRVAPFPNPKGHQQWDFELRWSFIGSTVLDNNMGVVELDWSSDKIAQTLLTSSGPKRHEITWSKIPRILEKIER